MTSDIAKEDIEQMWTDGLRPTVEDIVRLNALALQMERSGDFSVLRHLQRTCTITGTDIRLYEPTIAHELLLGHAADDIDFVHHETATIFRAFVLSFPSDRVPDYVSAANLTAAVNMFILNFLKGVPLRVLANAVEYVTIGNDALAYEFPEGDDRGENDADPRESIAIGVIHEGESLGLGISYADALRHTVSEMMMIVQQAVRNKCYLSGEQKSYTDAVRNKALGDYVKTKDSIINRLKEQCHG